MAQTGPPPVSAGPGTYTTANGYSYDAAISGDSDLELIGAAGTYSVGTALSGVPRAQRCGQPGWIPPSMLITWLVT
jgi:hypothetical protein